MFVCYTFTVIRNMEYLTLFGAFQENESCNTAFRGTVLYPTAGGPNF